MAQLTIREMPREEESEKMRALGLSEVKIKHQVGVR